ncbi:MAG: alpha/beta hydrolase [Planctomycetota bacterium]
MSRRFSHLLIVLAIVTGMRCDLHADDPDTEAAFATASRELQAFDDQHRRVCDKTRVPIHYLSWVDEGTPLVLLHGTYSSAHDFARFAPRLVRAGYRPLAVDWYGHGQTPLPDHPVTARDFADDLKQLLDELGIQRAVIAGHSRGGTLGSAFYAAWPDRVAGLVLVDGGSTCMANYFASLDDEELNAWMQAAFDPETQQPLAPSYASREALFAAAWKRFGKPEDPVEMFDILSQCGQNNDGRWTQWRQALRRWLHQDNLSNTFEGMRRPQHAPPFFRSTVLFEPMKAFESLDVPVVILDATGHDTAYRDTTPREENERLSKRHPHWIEHVQVPTGHFVHREAPDVFVDSLVTLRKRLQTDVLQHADGSPHPSVP